MRKVRKGKKMLIILFIAIVIVAAIFIIKGIVDKKQGETQPDDVSQVIALPETTYSNMEVRNIEMEYLKDNDETMVTMEIHNTTSDSVVNEDLDAILIGANGNVLGQIQTYIQELKPEEQYDISVILKGDLTATTQIKLVEK